MDLTSKLLRVFLVEKQLRGLQTRLRSAERFHSDQSAQLQQLDTKRTSLESQLRQITAVAADQEGEVKRLDEKMAVIREQMNSAQTNKEYKAFLTEMNTYKAERDRLETGALEQMAKAEELRKQVAELAAQRGEREQVQKVAAGEKTQRADEIKDRVEELKAQRKAAAAEVPPDALKKLELLIKQRGDEAMAPIEVQDRKRHEYTCGSCMMSLPVESVSGLMSSGKLTFCVSCQCILYLDEEAAKAMQPAASKR